MDGKSDLLSGGKVKGDGGGKVKGNGGGGGGGGGSHARTTPTYDLSTATSVFSLVLSARRDHHSSTSADRHGLPTSPDRAL